MLLPYALPSFVCSLTYCLIRRVCNFAIRFKHDLFLPDISMTVESARRNSENLPAAGENDSQYLELARKGGHRGEGNITHPCRKLTGKLLITT